MHLISQVYRQVERGRTVGCTSLTLRTPNISNAWPGPFTMVPCCWAHGPNFWALGPGTLYWQSCSNTSIGAMMMQLIARHRHWIPGIMKNGYRHCIAWAASMDEEEHHGPREGLEVARVDAPRCQHMKDNHRPHPPHTSPPTHP